MSLKVKVGADPQRDVRDHDFRNTVNICLENVPDSLARIFVLRDIEEMESDEMCSMLGITSSNLYTALHRVRFRLRECLETR